MRLSCPFCPAEIEPETTECLSCQTTYDLDTLKFLRILVRESLKEEADERREDIRVPATLKVSYSTPTEFVENYIFNFSLGGLFIQTEEPLPVGERTNLKIFIPDKNDELEVTGTVAWNRLDEEITPDGELPAGMGIKFLDPSKKTRERLIGVLSRALHDVQAQPQPAADPDLTHEVFVCG